MVLMKKNHNNFLFSSSDCLIFYDSKNLEDKLIKIPEPVLPENLTKGQIEVLKKETRNITSFDINDRNGYVVISTENKQMVVFDKQFNVVKNLVVSRAASKVCFTPTNDVLLADKTGDVYLYKINTEEEPLLLLGHLSIILDIILTDCGKYIITCDRDEKIRVSCFPNAYNIMSFCLGHTEFVTNIRIVQNTLVSASGDGTIRFWNYLDGKQLGIINTNCYITDGNLIETFISSMDKEKVDVTALPITEMHLHNNDSELYIAVSIYSISGVHIYKTDLSSFSSNFVMKLDLSSSCFSLYLCDKLYVISNKFLIFKLINDRFVESSVPSLENLYDKYKDVFKQSDDNTITMLYKRKFDNVQEYMERKRKRLETK